MLFNPDILYTNTRKAQPRQTMLLFNQRILLILLVCYQNDKLVSVTIKSLLYTPNYFVSATTRLILALIIKNRFIFYTDMTPQMYASERFLQTDNNQKSLTV